MKKMLYLTSILLLLFGCQQEESPKVVRNANTSAEIKRDSSLVVLSSLPVHIDSTNYLIFPIGHPENIEKSFDIKSGSYGKNYSLNSFTRVSGDMISGNFSNLKIQQIEEGSFKSLTDKNIRIQSVNFLRDIFQNSKKQLLLYTVVDADTNRDKTLDTDDLKSLYMSKIDGSGFQKISEANLELVDWKIIAINNRLYFRSIEDTTQDGIFNEEDSLRYFFVDLSNDNWEAQEYNPL